MRHEVARHAVIGAIK